MSIAYLKNAIITKKLAISEKKRKKFYKRTVESLQKTEVPDELKADLKKIYISEKILKIDKEEIGEGFFGDVFKGHLKYQDTVVYTSAAIVE